MSQAFSIFRGKFIPGTLAARAQGSGIFLFNLSQVQRMVIIAEYFDSWHPTYKCVFADQLEAEVVGCMDTHNIFSGEGESCVDTALELWSLVRTVKMPTLLQHLPIDTEK